MTWGDRDLLNSPYPVIIRDGSDMGDAAAAAGGMNAHQNYNLSSYREQHSSSNTSQQQQKGMCEQHGATSCQQSMISTAKLVRLANYVKNLRFLSKSIIYLGSLPLDEYESFQRLETECGVINLHNP